MTEHVALRPRRVGSGRPVRGVQLPVPGLANDAAGAYRRVALGLLGVLAGPLEALDELGGEVGVVQLRRRQSLREEDRGVSVRGVCDDDDVRHRSCSSTELMRWAARRARSRAAWRTRMSCTRWSTRSWLACDTWPTVCARSRGPEFRVIDFSLDCGEGPRVRAFSVASDQFGGCYAFTSSDVSWTTTSPPVIFGGFGSAVSSFCSRS